MTRGLLRIALLAFAGLLPAQQQAPPAPAEPPEEDASLKEKEYTLNPLQAEKEYKIGLFYAKKGSWKAAAGRFEEATKWNPALADAYLKLADAADKLNAPDRARRALEQFLEAAPDDKRAAAVKKRLAAYPASSDKRTAP